MTFTKKQASIASAVVSVSLAILGGIEVGIMAAVGFFILLTA
jgi:hypothetical protein